MIVLSHFFSVHDVVSVSRNSAHLSMRNPNECCSSEDVTSASCAHDADSLASLRQLTLELQSCPVEEKVIMVKNVLLSDFCSPVRNRYSVVCISC